MAVERKQTKRRPFTRMLAVSCVLIWLLAGCAAQSTPQKIALLAPFEGEFRDIGYNALYAMRLAFADEGRDDVQLLAIDDGGTSESASQRMRALNLDPDVKALIVLGSAATHPAVQQLNDKPLILIGNWGHDRADDNSFYAADSSMTAAHTADDLIMFEHLSGLRQQARDTIFTSSGSLADAGFAERYLSSDLNAPTPDWLTTLTYDLTRMALRTLEDGNNLSRQTHEGANGEIRFDEGFWQDAPLYQYRIDADELIPVDD